MTHQKIIFSTLWQLGSQGVSLLLGILSVKLVTLSLSKELVGNYQTAYGYLQIFGILADFGLYAVSIQELARARDRLALFRIVFLLRAMITMLSLGSALLLAWVLPMFRGTPLPLGITVASLVPFFTLLSGMFRAAFQVDFAMRPVFLAEVLSRAVTLLLMLCAFSLGVSNSLDPTIYLLFLAFGSVGSLILFSLSVVFAFRLPWIRHRLSEVFQRFSHADAQEFIRIARLAFPYGFAFFATTIYRQTDVTLIAVLRNDYALQNAYYGTMMRIAEVGFLLPTFLLNSTLPLLSVSQGDHKKNDLWQQRLRSNIFLSILTLGSVVAAYCFFWSRPIALLLTQESYLSSASHAGSDTALMLLSVSMFFAGIVSYCFYLLLTLHAWRPLLLVNSTIAILSLLLNGWLIPRFGFIGAGFTSIIVHFLLAISLSALTLKKLPIYLPFTKFFQWIGFTISLSALLLIIRPYLLTEWQTVFFGNIVLLLALMLAKIFQLFPRFHRLTD